MTDRLKFEPGMFYLLNNKDATWAPSKQEQDMIARRAQYLFDKWLESQTVFYGVKQDDDFWVLSATLNETTDTHTARLIDIRPIEKKECEIHIPKIQSKQPVGIGSTDSGYHATALLLGCSIICSKCGKNLKPSNWEPA